MNYEPDQLTVNEKVATHQLECPNDSGHPNSTSWSRSIQIEKVDKFASSKMTRKKKNSRVAAKNWNHLATTCQRLKARLFQPQSWDLNFWRSNFYLQNKLLNTLVKKTGDAKSDREAEGQQSGVNLSAITTKWSESAEVLAWPATSDHTHPCLKHMTSWTTTIRGANTDCSVE